MEPVIAHAEIGQLLDVATVRAPVPASWQIRNAHRAAEFEMPDGGKVAFYIDQQHSDLSSLNESKMQSLHQLYTCRDMPRVVANAQKRNKSGELCHYFDGIWVVTGAHLEKYVCF